MTGSGLAQELVGLDKVGRLEALREGLANGAQQPAPFFRVAPLSRQPAPPRSGPQLRHPRRELAGDVERALETGLAVALGSAGEQVALEQLELRQQGLPLAAAGDLERLIDEAEPFSRSSRSSARSRVDVEKQRPEHRRSLQPLVEVHALADLSNPLV